MLALIRIFKNLRDREHYLRTRYHRDHPHFVLYIALDVIMTLALVGGGMALVSANGVFENNPHILADLGKAPITEAQLKDQIQQHRVSMYWMGPSESGKYTSEVLQTTSVTIGYLGADSVAVEGVKPYLSVETFNDPLNYQNATRGPLHATGDVSAINSMGNEITYNPSDMQDVAINIQGLDKIVVIKFSTPQTVGELFEASEKLASVL